jgi:hypothetical protein
MLLPLSPGNTENLSEHLEILRIYPGAPRPFFFDLLTAFPACLGRLRPCPVRPIVSRFLSFLFERLPGNPGANHAVECVARFD